MCSKISSLFNKLKNNHSCGKIHPPEGFYRLSSTCQIPCLDYIYDKYFGRVEKGVFVEVGAFDGEYASNSSCLADKGWNGYYIEPIYDFYKLCCERHKNNKNVKVENLAIGAEDRVIEINMIGPLSTTRNDVIENFRKQAWAKNLFDSTPVIEKKKICQTTLGKYLKDNDVPSGFELLVVDVEGGEYNVFKAFDLELWRPKMIIVELHDQNKEYEFLRNDCVLLYNHIVNSKYRVIYKDFSNTIFVTEESYA